MLRLTLESLEAVARQAEGWRGGKRAVFQVCAATECVSAKSLAVRDALEAEIRRRGLQNDVEVTATGCHGLCGHGPVLIVQPEGVFYERLKAEDAPRLIESHFVRRERCEDLLYRENGDGRRVPLEQDIAFFAKQSRVAFRNRGRIDPEEIEDAIRAGAYRALQQVLREDLQGEALIERIARSGLRGRGGGGFPTGAKWQSCLEAARARGARPYVVCNADAGGGAAVMDRVLVESDPHAVIEGMLIGARALGALEGFVYIRLEYALALRRLSRAIAQAREWGLLGRDILGTGMEFDLTVHRGAGAFVCGESTALIASMEGRAGEPRATYVHTAEAGFRNQPTVVNNVETWTNIPPIVLDGPERFAAIRRSDGAKPSRDGSSGTKVVSLLGSVRNPGLVEVPMGTTLREIVVEIGGGVPGGRKLKAVQAGGPCGGILPESRLDLPLDFETLVEAGSVMGSGGLIVMDDRSCVVEAARYAIEFLSEESCGKCTPCREGLVYLREVLTRITRGEGGAGDLELLEDLCATLAAGSLCGLGQTAPNMVRSSLRYFRDEYAAHVRDRRCPGAVCKELIRYTITADCTGCTSCVKVCPTEAITGERKQLHVIDQDKCIRCGSCFDVCNDNAVLIR